MKHFQTKAYRAFFQLAPELRSSKHGRSLFIQIIYDYYRENKRPFAWRDCDDTYKVFVSEVMLQQTQTTRVIDKFAHFTTLFPTWQALARAPRSAVLAAWQGLGYNRRGKFLHESAQRIVGEFGGVLPCDPEELVTLPGIGPATASSVAAFAYNKPTVFIETNIRSVFIHFFFAESDDVHDAGIFPLIEQTLDRVDPRQWYYALMDYGVMLKKELGNPSRKSRHHTKQSKFEGSDRQIRGAIIRTLTKMAVPLKRDELIDYVVQEPRISATPDRVTTLLEGLSDERMLTITPDDIVTLDG